MRGRAEGDLITRKGSVAKEAEIGITQPCAKEYEQSLEAGKGNELILLLNLALKDSLQTSDLQNCK